MLVSARDLVLRLPDANERAIRVGLSGNLCRCTGYVGIVRAVQSVIEARRGRGIASEPGGGRKALGPVGAHPGKVDGKGSSGRLAPAETARRVGLVFDAAGYVRSHQLPVLVARFDKG